jgi:hypothetical protein
MPSPTPPRRGAAAFVLVAVALVASGTWGSSARGSSGAAADPSVDVYRGLGTWVDIYDGSAWADPRAAVASMKAHGVRTLYLQTSNFNRGRAFVFPTQVDGFVDAAHEAGLGIVAWYLPGFDDVGRDARRSLAAIRFRTAAGNGFDSFALDIESPTVRSPSARTTALLDLSSRIRSAAGAEYPLGAIIPSPLGMQANPHYWPRFPYTQLDSTYDVFLPMTYYTWRVKGMASAHDYTVGNVDLIREQTADPTEPIHVIGGIANQASVPETTGFVRAVRERGIIGASYYTFPMIRSEQWPLLRQIAANPAETPALPIALPFADPLGNLPGGDRSHPKELVYTTGGISGDATLSFDGFDVQRGEVAIYVNWQLVGHIGPATDGDWSGPRTRTVPAKVLHNLLANTVAFVARGNFPDWSEWGVRSVGLVPASP